MDSIKNNNNFTLYSRNIIDENEFNELMISNDENIIFDSFIGFLDKVCQKLENNRFNIIDIKRLFSICLKIFDIFMFTENWKDDFTEKDIVELENVYDKTYYIVNNIDGNNVNMNNMMEAINTVNNFWNQKLEEQNAMHQTLMETNDVLSNGMDKLNDSLQLNKISDFVKNNFDGEVDNSEMIDLYLKDLEKILLKYPNDIILEVNNNIKNDSSYYSKNINQTKERADELTIYNVITTASLLLNMK